MQGTNPLCQLCIHVPAGLDEEQEFPADSTWVRIGAKGGGCSGFSYVLDFDLNGPTEYDLSFELHGVRLVIDKKSEFFMGGTTVDFNDGLLERGFLNLTFDLAETTHIDSTGMGRFIDTYSTLKK